MILREFGWTVLTEAHVPGSYGKTLTIRQQTFEQSAEFQKCVSVASVSSQPGGLYG